MIGNGNHAFTLLVLDYRSESSVDLAFVYTNNYRFRSQVNVNQSTT